MLLNFAHHKLNQEANLKERFIINDLKKLKELLYHLKLHSHEGIFFLLPAIPVIMIQVPSTVPKIKMIFYTKFLYTEDETKTCLQEINKSDGLSQVMLRSTVYI